VNPVVAGAVPPPCHGRREVTTLAADPRSVHAARDYVTSVLHAWGLDGLASDVALVASELVTNAVEASGSPVQLALFCRAGWVVVAVADSSPGHPVRACTAPGAESGRGLAVVEELSGRWGWRPVTWPGMAKVVWAGWKITPNVSLADAASQKGGDPVPGT